MALFTDPTEDTFHTVQLIKLPADKKWCIGIDVSLHCIRDKVHPSISVYTDEGWCGYAKMILNKSANDSASDFLVNQCEECELYDSEIDPDDDNYCPCYHDGISAVTFPCAAGLDGPDLEAETYESPRMRFNQILPDYRCDGTIGTTIHAGDNISATLASVWYEPSDDAVLYAGNYKAANTFDNAVVCWDVSNSIEAPSNIGDAMIIYAASRANEDLIEYEDFTDNIERLNDEGEWTVYDHNSNELIWLQMDESPGLDIPVTPLPSAVACINRYANREVFYRLRAMGVTESSVCKDWIFVVLDHFYCDDFTGYISRDIKRPCAFTLQGIFCGQIPQDSLPQELAASSAWGEPQSAFVPQADITLDTLHPLSHV